MLLALLLGFALGFFGSIPLAGPIAVLVFRCGLRGSYRNGLFIALGAALPEGLYALGACWGTSRVLVTYPLLGPLAGGLAALILLVLGLAFVFRPYADPTAPVAAERKRGSFALGFTVTALNPTFLATWATAVAALDGAGLLPAAGRNAPAFGLGVSVGIVCWFWVQLRLLRRFRLRMSPTVMHRVQQGVGAFLVGFALLLASRLAATPGS